MLYKNKKNGIVIDTKAKITGENWEPVKKLADVEKEPVEEIEEPKEPKKKAKKGGK